MTPSWDGPTYDALDRICFELDGLLRRMQGLASTPRVPHPTDVALTQAWSLGVDAALTLYEERARLILAKVEHDRAA